MRLSISILVGLLFFSFYSCSDDNMEERMEALAPQTISVGDKFYEHQKNKKLTGTEAFFTNTLYETYTKEEVKIIFDDIYQKYGLVKDANLINTRFTTSLKDGNKQYFISNSYKVLYSNGFLAKEQLNYLVQEDTKVIDRIDGYSFSVYTEQE